MRWMFAKSEGGRASGFHDAGVETFKGNFDRYLARELIQNSLDARLDLKKPVRVAFYLAKFKRKEIPDIEGLKTAFERSIEYWKHDKKAAAFFEQAVRIASSSSIDVLRVSDFNTTGVLGSDTEREKSWFNLIRSAGSSSKGGGEGGSFGIGKNAPFAASRLRTVFYTTYNSDEEHIFQGVSMLVSHLGSDGKTTLQPVGYLGDSGGASLRKRENIPVLFIRENLETEKPIMGTEISIVGFDARENWEEDLIYSVLDNFWASIEFGDLEVFVGEQKINQKTLPEFLQKYKDYEDFNAHLYYEAYKNASLQVLNHELFHLRSVNLFLLTGDKELPKKVIMIRKTGMKIFEKSFRSIIPFIGVFICRNDVGNLQLREMEPPRHDIWDPNYPEKGANKKIENEYTAFIRSRIKELAPVDNNNVIAVPELNRYLPDDDDMNEESLGSSEDTSKKENYNRQQPLQIIIGQPAERKKQKLQRDSTEPNNGSNITDFGEGDSPVEGGNTEPNNSDGGDSHNPDGKGTGNTAGLGEGNPGGSNAKPVIPVQYRTFVTDLASGIYRVTVKPEKSIDVQAELVFWVIGDDQKVGAEIQSARFVLGADLAVEKNNIVGPLSIPAGGAQVEITLKTPRKVAMEVVAHEII